MKRALSTAITIIVLAFFAHFIITFHWRAVWIVLAHAAPLWVLLATVANIGSLAAKAQGWRLLMGEEGARETVRAQEATFIGAATGSFAISIGGEAARVRWMVVHSTVTAATALRALVRSRVTEILMFSTLILGGSMMLPRNAVWRMIELAAVIVIVTGITLWRIGQRATEEKEGKGTVDRILAEARETLRSPNVASALVFGAINWAFQWISFAACAMAVAAHAPGAYALAALILVNIGGAARITPGNVGILTAAYVMVAASYGVSAAAAVAASIVLQAVQILPIAAIGAVIFTLDRKRTGPIVPKQDKSV